jgi:hypothetical protein
MSHLAPFRLLDAKRKRLLSGSATFYGRTIVHLQNTAIWVGVLPRSACAEIAAIPRLAAPVRILNTLRIYFLLARNDRPTRTVAGLIASPALYLPYKQ